MTSRPFYCTLFRQSPYLLLLCFIVMSCGTHDDKQAKRIIGYDSSLVSKAVEQDMHRDTIEKNGISLVQLSSGDQPEALIALSGDTIIKARNYYQKIVYTDINEDGYLDIRVFIFSNTPNQCENYFFDKKSNCFRQIVNSDLDIEKVRGTDLYYSYNRAGCADMNWESHLSEIKDWQEVNIGYINGKECGENDDGIYIYKTHDGKKILLDRLRIDSVLKRPADKWEFIERFWKKNYLKFQKEVKESK